MKKIRPRFVARFLAFLFGYFWLPCPLCGKPFAGFECSEDPAVYAWRRFCPCSDHDGGKP